MRYYTDRYNQARQAGAKPILHCYVKSNYSWRCFGKEHPAEAHLRTDVDVFDWQARVLSFGDYRVSLASESENVFLALQSVEMSAYTLTLDNADRYFTTLLEDEVLLSGGLYLYQGFAYPGFTFADFIPLFSGKISKVELSTLTCQLTADTIVKPAEPEDPAVDTTTTYSLSVALETETAAEEELTYALLESWYELTAWSVVLEIERTLDDTEEVLLSIVNAADSATRIEIGIDADDKLYLSYSTDIDDSGTIQTLTGFDVATGYSRIQIDVDPPTVNFSDNHGNSASESITVITGMSIEHYETIGTTLGRGISTDTDGNIYIADTNATYSFEGNTYRSLIKLDSGYNEISETPGFKTTDIPVNQAPHGIFVDPVGTGIYLSSQSYHVARVTESPKDIIFYQDGLTELMSGYGIIAASYVYVTDYDGHQIIVLNRNDGTYESTIGEYGTGNLQFNYPIDIAFAHDGNILVLDESNFRVQKMSQAGVYMSQFGSEGLGDGQFKWPVGIAVDPDTGDIYVADAVRNDIQRFNYLGVYQEKIALDFNSDLGGLAYSAENDRLYVVRYQNDIVEVSTRQIIGLDFTDNGSNDTVSILPLDDNTSLISATVINETGDPVLQWQNVGEAAAIDLVDQIGSADILITDGVWTEYGTLEAYTEELTYVEQISYETEFIPATTDLYTNSNQQNMFLPLPYGDMTENSDFGAWVAPCIDTINHVYCLAGWPVVSIANGNSVSVYVDGVLQTSGYTFDEVNNYESQGNIAIITFTSDQGDAVVTVKAKGRDSNGDGTGTLLTNPIDIIEDLLDYASTYFSGSAWELDALSFAMAKEETVSNSYTCAGVINAANPLSFWIKSILASFLMTHEFDNEGKLAIRYLQLENTEDIKETIEEYEAISLSASQQSENLCNRLIINYANSYAEIDKRYKTGGEISYYRTLDDTNQASINTYGEFTQTLNFNWTRNTNTVLTLATLLLNRYSSPLWSISYQGQDIKFLPIDLLDQLEGTFNFFPGQTAICELREKVINLDDFTSTLSLQIVDFSQIDIALTGNVYIASIDNPVYIGSTDGKVFIGGI